MYGPSLYPPRIFSGNKKETATPSIPKFYGFIAVFTLLLHQKEDTRLSLSSGGCSSVVECELPKLEARVRFPSPAPLQVDAVKPLGARVYEAPSLGPFSPKGDRSGVLATKDPNHRADGPETRHPEFTLHQGLRSGRKTPLGRNAIFGLFPSKFRRAGMLSDSPSPGGNNGKAIARGHGRAPFRALSGQFLMPESIFRDLSTTRSPSSYAYATASVPNPRSGPVPESGQSHRRPLP